jgi:hypothetical protein
MNRQIDRRQSDRRADEAPSPEFLRVLEICGGEIRQSDRAALAGRPEPQGASDRRKAAGTPADRVGEPSAPRPGSFTS